MKPLPKQYEHTEAEPRLQKAWEESGVHAWDESQPRANTYVIDTPPPTVSGVLHMGHIFSYTQADFIARFQRMSGKTVFYPMGFDNNGLPTERLVEKDKKIRAGQLPREEFIKLCQDVAKEYEDQFRDMFKSVALSVDWAQEYTTISAASRRISQMSFLDLFKKGQVYRDFRPTYWDWVDQTAIAQAEIENKEMPGVMNEIQFTLEGGAPLVIMTTRPELLGACVAVMYHPEDPNAANYAGKYAMTPLFGVKVPMIADEAVEREKGTGLVMCCTFGDDTDKEWWRKYKLPMRALLSQQGKLDFENELFVSSFVIPAQAGIQADQQAPKAFAGMDPGLRRDDIVAALAGLKPKQANTKIIELLQASGELLKQTPMVHTVKCAERSGTPIEIIPTHQWFVRIMDKKEALLAKGAECVWHPEFMHLRLNQWIEGLKEDWCISRQRYSGVPFPVWYEMNIQPMDDQPLKIVCASKEQLPVDPLVASPARYKKIPDSETEKYGFRVSGNFHGKVHINPEGKIVALFPDIDIMDTWATSSVSPQLNSQGISKEFAVDAARHEKLFPADLRPQAHEIIRTWAFYTIVKALLHENTIPWKNLMISGWCLAADKTKMSKSKGNVVTPVELVREKGADAVRYWASTSRLGTDTAFSEDLLKIGRKLVTKMWNASQFVATQIASLPALPDRVDAALITEPLDRWIITRLQQTIAKATKDFAAYEYCDARVAAEEFFWKDFCDNYLELVKGRAYGETGTPEGQRSAQHTLVHCLDGVLRLFAPFIPHVTEEIYSHIFESRGSLHARGSWPDAANYFSDEAAAASGLACVAVLNAVRKAKSEKNVSIKFPIAQLVISGDQALLAPTLGDLKNAGNIAEIIFGEVVDGSATEDGRFKLAITFAEQAEVA